MTDHAIERSLQRGIQRADITRIINNPIETIQDARTGRYKSYGEGIDSYTRERVYVIIIHTPFNKNVKIITVMSVNSERGLRAYGFSNF
jgi:uncharacterized membrane-anchored protein YitT (DUF2179 family)